MGLAELSDFKPEEIAKTNAWLEGLPAAEQPVELLKWVNQTLAPGAWVQFTSFGATTLPLPLGPPNPRRPMRPALRVAPYRRAAAGGGWRLLRCVYKALPTSCARLQVHLVLW